MYNSSRLFREIKIRIAHWIFITAAIVVAVAVAVVVAVEVAVTVAVSSSYVVSKCYYFGYVDAL